MPYWLYDKDELVNTPSTKDSIDPSTEARYRREGARFIIEVGTELGLRFDTMASGVVYYHRFYMIHSFKEFPRFVTGSACLFLAGKVEETPKKCKDIIRVARTQMSDTHWSFFGDDPREEIMTYERILLQSLKFDLQIEHPYSYLLKHAKSFKGEKDKIQKLVQMAWTFVNDSLCTTLCLEWEPDIISIAFLYLAGRLSKSDLLDWTCKNSRIKWWENLNEEVTIDMLEEICHRLLDLYASGQQEKKGLPPSTPTKVSTKRQRSKTPPAGDAEELPIIEPVAKIPKPTPVIESKPSPVPVETPTPARPTVDQPDWSKQHVPPPAAPAAAPTGVPPPTTTAPYPAMPIPPVSNYTAPPPVQPQYSNPYPAPPAALQQSYNPAFKTAPQQYQQPPPVTNVPNTQYGGYGSQYYGTNAPRPQQPQQQQQPQSYNQPNTYNQSYQNQPVPPAPYSGPPPAQRPPVANMGAPNMNVPPPGPAAQNVHRHGNMSMHAANMNVPPPPLRNAPPSNMNVPQQMGGPNHRQQTALLEIPTKPPPNYGAYPPAQDNKPMDYPPSQYGNYSQPPPSLPHQMNTVRPPHPPHNMNTGSSTGLPTIRITGRSGPHGNMR